MTTFFVAVLCVLGMAVGQILFKISANSLHESGSFFSAKTLLALSSAICLYGITSLTWVWVLQHTELGKVYPLMAFAFVLVPIGSYFFFGERFQTQYLVGVGLIVAGIVVATKS